MCWFQPVDLILCIFDVEGVQLAQHPDRLNSKNEMAYERVVLMMRYMPVSSAILGHPTKLVKVNT